MTRIIYGILFSLCSWDYIPQEKDMLLPANRDIFDLSEPDLIHWTRRGIYVTEEGMRARIPDIAGDIEFPNREMRAVCFRTGEEGTTKFADVILLQKGRYELRRIEVPSQPARS